jgi:hypothetical protein
MSEFATQGGVWSYNVANVLQSVAVILDGLGEGVAWCRWPVSMRIDNAARSPRNAEKSPALATAFYDRP